MLQIKKERYEHIVINYQNVKNDFFKLSAILVTSVSIRNNNTVETLFYVIHGLSDKIRTKRENVK